MFSHLHFHGRGALALSLPSFRKLGETSVNWCHPVGAACSQFLFSVLISEYFKDSVLHVAWSAVVFWKFLSTTSWDMSVNTGERSPGAVRDDSWQLLPPTVTCPVSGWSVAWLMRYRQSLTFYGSTWYKSNVCLVETVLWIFYLALVWFSSAWSDPLPWCRAVAASAVPVRPAVLRASSPHTSSRFAPDALFFTFSAVVNHVRYSALYCKIGFVLDGEAKVGVLSTLKVGLVT